MKKILYIVIAVLVLVRLFDFTFHGGNTYDLLGAVGFAVLLMASCRMNARAVRARHWRLSGGGRRSHRPVALRWCLFRSC